MKYDPNSRKKFFHDSAGSVAPILAIAIIPVIGVLFGAIDFSRAIQFRSNVQSCMEQAALAMPRAGLTAASTQQARDDFVRDFISKQPRCSTYIAATTTGGQGQGKAAVQYTTSITSKGRIKVAAEGEMDTRMLGLFGQNKFTVGKDGHEMSIEVAANSKIELALVLDNTGSMGWYSSGARKIDTLKTVSKTLIDNLFQGDPERKNTKVGIVPFARYVNVGTQYSNASWMKNVNSYYWRGCVLPRDGNKHINNVPATESSSSKIKAYNSYYYCNEKPLTRLSNDPEDLKDALDEMHASGSTYIPLGLAWGWRVVTNVVPFTEAKPYGDPEWKKVIVLMTDGANTVNYSNTNKTADEAMKALCNKIKNKDITIFSIGFALSGLSNNHPTKKALRDCATHPSYYFDATTPSSLTSAFATIALEVSELRVSK